MDLFLVRIFPHLDWIRRDTSIQSECRKVRTEKKPVFGLFSRSNYCEVSLCFGGIIAAFQLTIIKMKIGYRKKRKNQIIRKGNEVAFMFQQKQKSLPTKLWNWSWDFAVIVLHHRNTIFESSFSPASIYLPKVNNRNTRTKCEICSKLTIKTPDTFIVNFEHISHLVLVFLLLNLKR